MVDRWTDVELKAVIAMLRDPEFDSKEVDPDLHKRMQKAVDDGMMPSIRKSATLAQTDTGLTVI